MRGYVIRRLLSLLPTLFFASLIVFITVRLIPGDIIDMMLSQNVLELAREAERIIHVLLQRNDLSATKPAIASDVR